MASELHLHTMYSILDGFGTPEEYLQRAVECGLKSIAVTEHGNMYSWLYFYQLKDKYPIKILYGVELYEAFDSTVKDKSSRYFHLIAIAKNERGRIALNTLVTQSNREEHFFYKPRIDLEMLKLFANDLIISSACLASKLAREEDYNKCVEYVDEYKSIFPNFYLEMQSHTATDQVAYNKKILQLAQDTNTEFIITSDVHAATEEDLYYQGRFVQIAQDSDTMSEFYGGCYIKSEEETHEIMDSQIGYDNVVRGLDNTDKIADLVEDIKMPFQEPKLPTFPLPQGFKDNYEYLQHLVEEGWNTRKFNTLSISDREVRKERIEMELDVIHNMGYDGYFLFVWDFLNFCKRSDIPTGAGRGSGAGSIVCYLLGITNLDPIKYGLIFERFLNPERQGLPDIDSDIFDRKAVISYLEDKYGIDNVCQITNFGYITPVVAIKDTGRILKLPYNIVERIAKRFSYSTFKECIEHNPNIYQEFESKTDEEFNQKLKELFDIVSKITGKIRQVGTHAGGLCICDDGINNYMAMSKENTIQVDKRLIENIGLVKFDLLGLSTLSILDYVKKNANLDGWQIDINNPNFYNDTKSFDLLCSAKTDGVFQVASLEMKNLLTRLQPRTLEELSDLIALFRPDAIQYIEPYINRKNGLEKIEYIHDDMAEFLGSTYGCMLYQEQMLGIIRKFSGRSYGQADLFRKAVGKKNKELIKQESEKLYFEIKANGYSEDIARAISDEMADKGGYGFNKSHSMAYAGLCLQTAYLKANYTEYFFAALLNMSITDNGKINRFIVDANDFNVEIAPPHINKSQRIFSVSDGKVLFGLQGISGIGGTLADFIIQEREEHGHFKGLNDFITRINPSTSQMVSLVKSGAIPCTNKKNCLLKYFNSLIKVKEYTPVKSLPTLLQLQVKWDIDTEKYKTKDERLEIYNQKRKAEYNKTQELTIQKKMKEFTDKYLKDENMWEFETLSVFLKDNPFTKLYSKLGSFAETQEDEQCVIVGVVSKIVKKKDKNKNQYAFITMYSAEGVIEVTCWSNQFAEYQNIIEKGNKLAILCKKEDNKAFVKRIKTLEQWTNDTGIEV